MPDIWASKSLVPTTHIRYGTTYWWGGGGGGGDKRVRELSKHAPKNCLRLFSDQFRALNLLEDENSSHGKPSPIPKEEKLISCMWM
jgi:hypothetical protein